jgi:alkylation response protein AidB-like acyl-CoA dehydrogenase
MGGTVVNTDEGLVAERLQRLLAEHDPAEEPAAYLGARYDLGLAWVWFPPGLGGLGVDRSLQLMVDDRMAEVGAPDPRRVNLLGVGMAAPVLLAHGTEEQQRRLLRPLFTGEEIWCQLFSEPGAGSDLASLATRAVRQGDEWVLDGQKVWTSLAHVSRRGMLVTRSDPQVPKHRGMTYFVLDMQSPGIEVRPLRQMTGGAEFTEVYFDGVRVPDADRVGAPGDGWRVALTTLMNERVLLGGEVGPRGDGPIGAALEAWQRFGHRDPSLRDRLMRLYAAAEAARLTNLRAALLLRRGTPGPEGSTLKVAFASLNQHISELTVELMGPQGMGYDSYEMVTSDHVTEPKDPRKAFVRYRGNSIEGGTSEVLKNVLGERVLGLPGEPRVDKDLPWSQVQRS